MKKGNTLTTNNPDGKRDILADFEKNSKILSVVQSESSIRLSEHNIKLYFSSLR
jgi:hypothetical protein